MSISVSSAVLIDLFDQNPAVAEVMLTVSTRWPGLGLMVFDMNTMRLFVLMRSVVYVFCSQISLAG